MSQKLQSQSQSINVKLSSDCHRLSHSFTFYYLDRLKLQKTSYKQALTKLVSFNTIEDFWSIYSYLKRIEDLQKFEYLLFRDNIVPMWEDDLNKTGGKWQFRFCKDIGNRLWETCILSWMSGEFDKIGSNEINGMVISTNNDSECVFSVWNTNSSQKHKYKVKLKIGELLNLDFVNYPECMKYRAHLNSQTKTTNNYDYSRPYSYQSPHSPVSPHPSHSSVHSPNHPNHPNHGSHGNHNNNKQYYRHYSHSYNDNNKNSNGNSNTRHQYNHTSHKYNNQNNNNKSNGFPAYWNNGSVNNGGYKKTYNNYDSRARGVNYSVA